VDFWRGPAHSRPQNSKTHTLGAEHDDARITTTLPSNPNNHFEQSECRSRCRIWYLACCLNERPALREIEKARLDVKPAWCLCHHKRKVKRIPGGSRFLGWPHRQSSSPRDYHHNPTKSNNYSKVKSPLDAHCPRISRKYYLSIPPAARMWNFRPSSFCSVKKYAILGGETLINQYAGDNERASEEGVTILPRSPGALIRTLQWNVHGWTTAHGGSSDEITKGFIDTIIHADADVIVLNEYLFCNRNYHHEDFEKKLRERGYYFFCCNTVSSFPTAIATRFHVFETREVLLSPRRSAVLLLVGGTPDSLESDRVWVIGTHLDHENGRQRKREMQTLLNYTKSSRLLVDSPCCDRVILMGDFNQQRQEDYTRSEWKQIAESMANRNVVEDDGVSTMLHKMNFKCAWTGLSSSSPDCTNWETSRPPSTHWTGTIVDYSYGRNVNSLKASISPVGWSDHRMTVCDWHW
jgi:endonuclease/exonuclease/phosphatase family metal-dependent hydrolase